MRITHMKRTLGVVLGAAVLTGACGAGPETRDTAADVAVAVAVARAATVQRPSYIEVGGVVEPHSTAAVSSRVMTVVDAVWVRPGDLVTRGQRLVTLDARELSARAAQAVAALEAASEAARAADETVVAAEADLHLAEVTLERISGLHARRSATAQELDQVVAARDAAGAKARGARAAAAAAASSHEAAVAAGQAASISRSYAVLTAPFDGVVAGRHVDAGALATPGAPLLLIEEEGIRRVEVRLDDTHASLASPGSGAEIRVDGGEDWVAARVIEVGRSDPATHSFLVTLEPDVPLAARSGSFARARFAGPARASLVVPAASVIRRGQLSLVYLVDAELRARLRPVVAGPASAGTVEILTGLREGDTVVVSPPPSLTDGARLEAAQGADEGDRR
jgi:RND family efflux transporter MFP subunit